MSGQRTEHKWFYVVMAVLLLATAIGGFAASYLVPVSRGTLSGRPSFTCMRSSRSLGCCCSCCKPRLWRPVE